MCFLWGGVTELYTWDLEGINQKDETIQVFFSTFYHLSKEKGNGILD